MYFIFRCKKCGRYLCMDERIGVKKCPVCGWVNKLGNLEIVEVAFKPKEAQEIIRKLQGTGTSFVRADRFHKR